jgi:hypothetical protein
MTGNSEAYHRHYADLDLINGEPHRFDNPEYMRKLHELCSETLAKAVEARKSIAQHSLPGDMKW